MSLTELYTELSADYNSVTRWNDFYMSMIELDTELQFGN